MAIRIGIIGPGLMWHKSHKPALEKFGSRVSIAALCARSQATLDKAGVEGAKQYKNIPEFLKDPDIDAVMVLTPLGLNASTAVAVLTAGKHVFLEKPMGISIAECRDIRLAEAASGKRVYVLEQAAYSAPLAAMQRVLAEKHLGELVMYDRIEHFIIDADENDAGGYGKTEWRQKAEFPLGTLFDGGIHSIAELTQIFGVPLRVLASGKKWRKGFGEYDEILMHFTYASGVRGVFGHSGAMPGAHCGFTIRGTKGTLRPAGDTLELTGAPGQSSRQIKLNEKDHAGMWEQILGAYEKGTTAHYTSANAAQDVAILEAVSKSIKSGHEEVIEKV